MRTIEAIVGYEGEEPVTEMIEVLTPEDAGCDAGDLVPARVAVAMDVLRIGTLGEIYAAARRTVLQYLESGLPTETTIGPQQAEGPAQDSPLADHEHGEQLVKPDPGERCCLCGMRRQDYENEIRYGIEARRHLRKIVDSVTWGALEPAIEAAKEYLKTGGSSEPADASNDRPTQQPEVEAAAAVEFAYCPTCEDMVEFRVRNKYFRECSVCGECQCREKPDQDLLRAVNHDWKAYERVKLATQQSEGAGRVPREIFVPNFRLLAGGTTIGLGSGNWYETPVLAEIKQPNAVSVTCFREVL